MGRLETGKFSSARAVWMPQYASAGISRDPRESVSVRVRVIASRAMCVSSWVGHGDVKGCFDTTRAALNVTRTARTTAAPRVYAVATRIGLAAT